MATCKPKKKSAEVLNENIEVDGKVETRQPTTLDQIWGDEGLSRYNTTDESEYSARLEDMMYVDLQNHAREVCLRPDVEHRVLKERLINEFRKHIAAYRGSKAPIGNVQNVNSKIAKILREGA